MVMIYSFGHSSNCLIGLQFFDTIDWRGYDLKGQLIPGVYGMPPIG